MSSRRVAQAALRCYPPATRTARGAEMLDALLEVSGDRHGLFVWNVVSLVTAGLGERARASARVSSGPTIVEAAKLASVLYACLWLTSGLAALIERRGWHGESPVSLSVVGLLIVLLAWSQGRQPRRRDRPRVHGAARRRAPAGSLAASVDRATDRAGMRVCDHGDRSGARASGTVAVGALAALVVVSVICGANPGGFGQLIVLIAASIAGVLIFAVQPRLAIAVAIIWTAIGIELIAFASAQPAPSKLLVGAAPAVLAATAARARAIRRRAI